MFQTNILGTVAGVKGAVSYFDTVALWLREPIDAATRRKLEMACAHLHVGSRLARWSSEFRQRLDAKRPHSEFLEWLSKEDGAHVNCAHVALDVTFASEQERDAVQAWLDRYLIRRWRRGGRIVVHRGVAGTRYEARRAAPNGVVVYSADHSRITGELNALHVEWRAQGIASLRRAGIQHPRDLLRFDQRKFWEKRLLICPVEPARLGRLWRNRHRGDRSRLSTVEDRRRGQILCNSCLGPDGIWRAQTLIQKYGRSLDLLRAFPPIVVEALLPPPHTHSM